MDLFGQDVVLIPIDDTTSTKLTPEADEDPKDTDLKDRELRDCPSIEVEGSASAVASMDRVSSYNVTVG